MMTRTLILALPLLLSAERAQAQDHIVEIEEAVCPPDFFEDELIEMDVVCEVLEDGTVIVGIYRSLVRHFLSWVVVAPDPTATPSPFDTCNVVEVGQVVLMESLDCD